MAPELTAPTDPDGAFLFSGLAPGRWTMSVAASDAPLNHRFHPESIEVTLAPGASARVAVRAVPVPRGVRWREGGELLDRSRVRPLPKR